MNHQSFGRYVLLRRMAVGGTTELWQARQPSDSEAARYVSLKRLLPHLAHEPRMVEVFRREALIAGNFNHPNIARIYEFGQVNDSHYIAREFIPGATAGEALRRLLPGSTGFPPALALRLICLACEGLHYVHMRTDHLARPLRLAHLDAHLDTLLIGFKGEVKWIGFGRIAGAGIGQVPDGYMLASAVRMAPEQLRDRPVDHRTDIFALGSMLYELLTGVRPFKRDSQLATLKAIIDVELRPPSEVADTPGGLGAIVMKAMAGDPEERYSSARELQLELELFMAGQRWEATPEQLGQLVSGPGRGG
jgi:serine/threonine protein kinase